MPSELCLPGIVNHADKFKAIRSKLAAAHRLLSADLHPVFVSITGKAAFI
jgi:hypothetical protein